MTRQLMKVARTYKHYVFLPFRACFDLLAWHPFLSKNQLSPKLKYNLWSMGVQDFEYILGLIRQGKSNEILELGSGTSTLIFASEIAKLHGNGAIISLEGERQSFKKTQNLLHQCQLSHYAKVYHTPYERYPNYIWYNKKRVEAILKGKQFDVLIVDGPSGYIYPCSRMPAIPLLLPHIKQSGIIILHDAKRPDEDHIVREWRSFFHECEFINTRSGLAIFKHKRVTHKIEMLTS